MSAFTEGEEAEGGGLWRSVFWVQDAKSWRAILGYVDYLISLTASVVANPPTPQPPRHHPPLTSRRSHLGHVL